MDTGAAHERHSARPTQVLLARHGESTWNVERRWQGHGDPPLTRRGRAQAAVLAAAAVGACIDVIIASDLQRAAETARCVADALRLPLHLWRDWRELDVGEWTGLCRNAVQEGWPEAYHRFRTGDPDLQAGGAERLAEFRDRVQRARQRIEDEYAGRRVLVVTHRGVLRLLVPDVPPDHAVLITLPLAAR